MTLFIVVVEGCRQRQTIFHLTTTVEGLVLSISNNSTFLASVGVSITLTTTTSAVDKMLLRLTPGDVLDALCTVGLVNIFLYVFSLSTLLFYYFFSDGRQEKKTELRTHLSSRWSVTAFYRSYLFYTRLFTFFKYCS